MQLYYNIFLNLLISMSTFYGFNCQWKLLVRILKLGLEKSKNCSCPRIWDFGLQLSAAKYGHSDNFYISRN